jgi:predicted TPR repeat methyltransferase
MNTFEQTKQEAAAAFERGDTYNENKEYDLAIKEYTETIRLEPSFVSAYGNRGNIYIAKKEFDLAIKDYTEVIRLDPSEALAYFNRGITYSEKKEFDLAIRDYTEVIRLDPDDVSAYINRGICYAQKKEIDCAVNDLRKAISLEPENEIAKRNLAKVQLSKDTEEIVYDPNLKKPTGKCSFCGLPHDLTHGLIGIGNEKSICVKCIKKPEIMEKIKLENETLYNEIGEKYQVNLEFENRINSKDGFRTINNMEFYNGSPKWLTNLTIEELRKRAGEYKKPQSISIKNIPIHKNQSTELLEGEIFRKNSERNIEVSNLGRVKCSDIILEQNDPQNNGYLFVDIKSKRKTIQEKVYRLVAETWLEIPDLKWLPKKHKGFRYNTVHHISNNGYDNRIKNLMWVTEWQHAMIHPWLKIDTFDQEELIYLFNSYRDINIMPDDYQRIIDITKRRQQLDNAESETPGEDDYWYDSIIDAMEALMLKNS